MEEKPEVFEPIDFDIYYDVNSKQNNGEGRMNFITRQRPSQLNSSYEDDFFEDYCSCIWPYCDKYPNEEELFCFVKVLKVSRPYRNVHSVYIKQIFKILFANGRLQDFTGDFFLRVVFFSSFVNERINLQAVNVATRPEFRLQYSNKNMEYFSQFEVNAINVIKTIIKDILKFNGLLDHLKEDEFEIIVGNHVKANKIHIKPIPGEDDPDFWDNL